MSLEPGHLDVGELVDEVVRQVGVSPDERAGELSLPPAAKGQAEGEGSDGRAAVPTIPLPGSAGAHDSEAGIDERSGQGAAPVGDVAVDGVASGEQTLDQLVGDPWNAAALVRW